MTVDQKITVVTAVLAAILGTGGVITLVINRLNRRDVLADRAHDENSIIEEHTRQLEEITQCLTDLKNDILRIEDRTNASIHADMLVVKEKLVKMCLDYLERGWITYEEKVALHELHSAYHELGGNGDLNDLMEEVDELPVKRRK